MLAGVAVAGRKTSIDLRIVDSSGSPVPYATLWGATDAGASLALHPVMGGSKKPWQQLDVDDLRRIAVRYSGSFELAQLSFSPVKGITVFGMGDSTGVVRQTIDTDDLAVPSDRSFHVALVILKRGYVPGTVEFDATTLRRSFTSTVAMSPEAGFPGGDEPSYVKTFDRVRYALLDDVRNEVISKKNAGRLERLRNELEGAAEAALASGDRKAAARILARIETLPSVTMVAGKFEGYSSMTLEAPQSRAAIARAIELDPGDDNLAMRAVVEKGRRLLEDFSWPMSEADKERLRSYLKEEEAELAKHGDHAWMFDRLSVLYDYERLGMYEREYRELTKLREFEPRGADYDSILSKLKARMTREKVAVPEDWR